MESNLLAPVRVLSVVRLDIPSSRREDFQTIVNEVMWEMDLRGCSSVEITVSG